MGVSGQHTMFILGSMESAFPIFIALHGMQTRSIDENSVRLSVCHTRGL